MTTWLERFSSREGWPGSVKEQKLLLRELLEGIKDGGEDSVRGSIEEEALLNLRQVAFDTKAFQDPYDANTKSPEERQSNARLEVFNGVVAFQQLLYPDIAAKAPWYPFWTEMQHRQVIFHALDQRRRENPSEENKHHYLQASISLETFYSDVVMKTHLKEGKELLKVHNQVYRRGVIPGTE
ncbi:hypothetical protein JCM3765_006279 [Sporobolomyces pararoseus]